MRRVVLSGHGPLEVKSEDGSKWICQCGLSKNYPYCDGSHKKTSDEKSDIVYEYAKDGTRKEVN